MYKTLSRRRLTGLDLPLFGNQDDRPDYRTHMRYDARKLDYRLDKKLESHLFGPSHPSKKVKIHPKVAEELSKQLKQVMDTKVRKLKEVLLSPIKINSPLRPLTVDTVLDKIIDEGMESLTTEELDFLKKYNNI